MNNNMKTTLVDEPLAVILERDLLSRYGPLIGKEDLWMALGYPSNDAFRQGVSKKLIPIPIFEIENRRGKFALVKDLANWLAAKRNEEKDMK